MESRKRPTESRRRFRVAGLLGMVVSLMGATGCLPRGVAGKAPSASVTPTTPTTPTTTPGTTTLDPVVPAPAPGPETASNTDPAAALGTPPAAGAMEQPVPLMDSLSVPT